jgi:TetR/AcrR family transcriptional regulator, transcriptional repressor for nem operon
MKVSKQDSARHRDDLLRAASRLFRDKGFDKVGIAEIAAAAGLTHGAFYTHFASKEALCAEAIARATRATTERLSESRDWRGFVAGYLDTKHVRNRGAGCPYAALASDVPRENEAIKSAFSRSLEQSIDALAAILVEEDATAPRDRAISSLATMVGALVLARGADNARLRDQILMAAKAALLEGADV